MKTIVRAGDPRRRGRVIRAAACALVWIASGLPGGHAAAGSEPEVRVGIIGLDTSHVVQFTQLLNVAERSDRVPGARVVAAFPQGSRDIESSVARVPEYTNQLRDLGVEIVPSIEELLGKVDAVMLESNDGRVHLEQAAPVLAAGKRLFIDKPMTASLADAIAIFTLAREHGTPVFSSSSLRFAPGTQAVRGGSIGDVLGCDIYSPLVIEPTHPDLFWYGIHGCESLFTVMGPGCQTVRRTTTPEADVVVGVWEGGRIGTYRGLRNGKKSYGGTAFGTRAVAAAGDKVGYGPLVAEIVRFFQTGESPVPERETIELLAFMEAADESRRLDGATVALADVIARAQATAETIVARQRPPSPSPPASP